MNATDPILVGVALREDDAAVLNLAADLAHATGAPLVLLHAYPFQPLIAVPPPNWVDDLVAETTERLDALAAPLGATPLCRPSPSPVRALHEAAEEIGARLLVAGSSHRGAAGRVMPGGVAERLLHAAPCAVAIAPRGYTRSPGGLERVGVGFIAGPEAAEALALATDLAGHVTTYTVVGAEHAGVDEILDRARAAVPAGMLEATEVLTGDPAEALAAVSGDLDLLICGSRGYGPIRSLLLGGVTWELAHTAHCPLLVVPRALV